MTAWGIPDWREPKAYGKVESWGFDRWRWEFYRRRPDLREYFDRKAKVSDQPVVSVDMVARIRFGYSPLPNPRVGDHAMTTIMPHEHDGAGNLVEAGGTTFGELLKHFNVALNDEQKFMLEPFLSFFMAPLAPREIAVTFDLDKPIEGQLSHARDILRWHQAEHHEKPLQKRRHPEKWLSYLRALDARDNDPPASWSEIADQFYSEGVLERHKDKAGGYCAPPPQAARKLWVQAQALTINF